MQAKCSSSDGTRAETYALRFVSPGYVEIPETTVIGGSTGETRDMDIFVQVSGADAIEPRAGVALQIHQG